MARRQDSAAVFPEEAGDDCDALAVGSNTGPTSSAVSDCSAGSGVGVVRLSEIAGLPVVLDVPSAGRLLGIGRRGIPIVASGGFPCRVLRVGGSWRVPTAGVLEVLGLPAPVRQDRPQNGGGGRAGADVSGGFGGMS